MKATRSFTRWFWATFPYPKHTQITGLFNTPALWDQAFPHDQKADFGVFIAMPTSLSMAVDFLRELFGQSGRVASVMWGLLATPAMTDMPRKFFRGGVR